MMMLEPKGDQYDKLRELVNSVDNEMQRLVQSESINFGLFSKGEDGTDFPEDIRYELMRLGCSGSDYTFWVRKRLQEGFEQDPPIYYAHEIESGTGAWGVTPREALDHYFRDDVLDHRGDAQALREHRDRWHPGPNPVRDSA